MLTELGGGYPDVYCKIQLLSTLEIFHGKTLHRKYFLYQMVIG